MVSAVVVVENVQVQRGRVIVIPHSNQSGFTHTEPLEAFPHRIRDSHRLRHAAISPSACAWPTTIHSWPPTRTSMRTIPAESP